MILALFRFQGGSREEAPVPAIYSDDSLRAEGPRPIVVDGSNIAFAHGKSNFSVKGIQMVVNWFQARVALHQYLIHQKNKHRYTIYTISNQSCMIFYTYILLI